MSSLETIIQQVKTDLTTKNKIREETHECMRKAATLSKQSILLLHQKRFDNAQKMLNDAKKIIINLQKQAKEYPEIIYSGMFSATLQEYSEAHILLTLIKDARFTAPSEINVPPVDYILGLADVIGECRRLALDYLREGEIEKGVKCLEIMDQIFIQLLALDEAYMLVPGLRHKSDIARRIIETTRGDITLEVRRKTLEDLLKKFETPTKTNINKQAKT